MVSSAIGSGISLYYLGASGIHSHTRIGKHTLGQGKSSQRTTGIPTQLVVPKCKPVAALKREVIRSCLTATGNHSRRFPNTVFVQMWEIALLWSDPLGGFSQKSPMSAFLLKQHFSVGIVGSGSCQQMVP